MGIVFERRWGSVRTLIYGEIDPDSRNDRAGTILRNRKTPGTPAFQDWVTKMGKVA